MAMLALAVVLAWGPGLARGQGFALGGPGDGDVEITFIGPGDGGGKTMGMNDFGNSLPLLDLMNQPMSKVAPRDSGPVLMFGGPGGPGGGMIMGGGSDPMVDPFLMEMLARMGLGVGGMPKIHDQCEPDVKKWCIGDEMKKQPSVLHCLSTHASEISSECFNKIKKTLPHVCHEEIEELCGELIEDGILGCLEKQLSKLKGRCLDAYVTTRHHIDAAKDATSIDFLHKPTGKMWSVTAKAEEAWQNMIGEAQAVSKSASVLPVVICVSLVFLVLYWMSQDGNRQIMLSTAHQLSNYKFEQTPKARTADVAYGATLTI
jgi:hypothetical protein